MMDGGCPGGDCGGEGVIISEGVPTEAAPEAPAAPEAKGTSFRGTIFRS